MRGQQLPVAVLEPTAQAGEGGEMSRPAEFHILSLKWSRGDMLSWYRPNAQGYTWFLGEAGKFSETEARHHSIERITIAVPVEAADFLSGRTVCFTRKDELLRMAAAAGFVLPPEPPPLKREQRRCPNCRKFVSQYRQYCRSCEAYQ